MTDDSRLELVGVDPGVGESKSMVVQVQPPATGGLPDFAQKRLDEVTAQPVAAEILPNETLRVWNVPVSLIDLNPDNPNEQDEDTFNTLAEEIDEANPDSPGFIEPVHLVRCKDRFEMVGGEHRLRARIARGESYVPAIILEGPKWESKKFREFMLVRLNVLRGNLNGEKFLKLYQRHVEEFGNEKLQRLFAITDQDYWLKLTGGAKEQLRDMGASTEMLAEFDARSKEVKTVDDLAAILNGLFQKYGNDLRWSFMVFTFGSREHLMVRMDSEMARQMEDVKRYCRDKQLDINEVMKPIVARFAESVGASTQAKSKKAKAS